MMPGRAMLQTRFLTLCLALWVIAATSACSSRQPLQPSELVDENLDRASRAASMAFGKGAYEQAADLYRQTLEHAYARDDSEVIVDTQYNLAIVWLRLGALEEAQAAVDDAKSELSRRTQTPPVHLQLLDATLLFHAGQTAAAWEMSEQLLADSSAAEPEVLSRLHFLRGLIADERGDIERLRTSVAALETANSAALDADRMELRGRLEMAEQNWSAAADTFAAAAALHREVLDYPNMVRALAMAGEASSRMGRLREAAVFFFRAGRSASRLDMAQQALNWLTQAQQLAPYIEDVRTIRDIDAYLMSLKTQGQGK